MKGILSKFSVHKVVHDGHYVAHLSYLSAVSYEAHGVYGKAALALLLVTLIASFLHIEV